MPHDPPPVFDAFRFNNRQPSTSFAYRYSAMQPHEGARTWKSPGHGSRHQSRRTPSVPTVRQHHRLQAFSL